MTIVKVTRKEVNMFSFLSTISSFSFSPRVCPKIAGGGWWECKWTRRRGGGRASKPAKKGRRNSMQDMSLPGDRHSLSRPLFEVLLSFSVSPTLDKSCSLLKSPPIMLAGIYPTTTTPAKTANPQIRSAFAVTGCQLPLSTYTPSPHFFSPPPLPA